MRVLLAVLCISLISTSLIARENKFIEKPPITIKDLTSGCLSVSADEYRRADRFCREINNDSNSCALSVVGRYNPQTKRCSYSVMCGECVEVIEIDGVDLY